MISVVASAASHCTVCRGGWLVLRAIGHDEISVGAPIILGCCPHCGGDDPPPGFRGVPYLPLPTYKDRKRA